MISLNKDIRSEKTEGMLLMVVAGKRSLCQIGLTVLLLVVALLYAGRSAAVETENFSKKEPTTTAASDAAVAETSATAVHNTTDGSGEWVESLPEFARPLVEYVVFGYPVWKLVAVVVLLILAFIANTVLRYYLGRRLKEESEHDGATSGEEAGASGAVRSFLGLVLNSMILPARISVWAVAVLLIVPLLSKAHAGSAVWASQTLLSVALAVFIYQFVDVAEYYLMSYARKTETTLDDMLVPIIRKALRVVVIVVAGLHLYQSVTNESISTLLAGLGIGGLAFALAAQDMLKNIFGFVTIVLDRPFAMGERIVLDGNDGVVESVGLRSTRLRTLDGVLITVPNSRAGDAVVQNIGRRPYLKRVLNVTITYDTPVAKIERAIEIIKGLLENHEGMSTDLPPRVVFNDLNADSLNILVIYWYTPPEYWDFMAFNQKFNLDLMRKFEEEGIEFAFPTQTIYLAGDPKRELTPTAAIKTVVNSDAALVDKLS